MHSGFKSIAEHCNSVKVRNKSCPKKKIVFKVERFNLSGTNEWRNVTDVDASIEVTEWFDEYDNDILIC